jgi:hypothetical protein
LESIFLVSSKSRREGVSNFKQIDDDVYEIGCDNKWRVRSFAEVALANAESIAYKPKTLSHEEAAEIVILILQADYTGSERVLSLLVHLCHLESDGLPIQILE